MDNIIERIYAATSGGLDIILSYYPQAAVAVERPSMAFSLRNETAPSAHLKQIKGVWRITDFGEDEHARSPIDIVMREEHVEFNEALSLLAQRYNIDNRLDETKNRATVETRPATDEEPDGFFDFETHEITADELRTLGNGVKAEHAAALSFYALSWYAFTKNRKTTTIHANDDFPIFMRECRTEGESFYKVMKPLEPKKEYRFMSLGHKTENYINGLYELRKAHAKFVADNENSGDDDKPKPTKLPECVICSGERDAVCCLSRGYKPVWRNSENAELPPSAFHTLQALCERVYNLPDIDGPGKCSAKKLALKYLDLYTIELPQSLLSHRDRRGHPCKDMRDYCEFNAAPREFAKLVQTARSCKFWKETRTKTGIRTDLDVVNLLYFLEMNGYCRLVDKQTLKERIVRITDESVVSEATPNNIRDLLNNFCSQRYISIEVRRALIASRFTANVIDNLPVVDDKISFKNNTAASQRFRFANESIEVFADEVKKCKDFHIWEENVSPHAFKRLPPSFTAEVRDDGNTFFRINENESNFFRFCINSSRLHWKKEFEGASADYKETYYFSIDGPRLSKAEIDEQAKCLMAKLYAIGYMLHSYKDPSMPFIVWVLENNVLGDEASSGGSGKSFLSEALKLLKNVVDLNGRSKHLTDNQHYLERVDENTDILFIDDTIKYFDFDSFYTMATGSMIVNAKHVRSKEIRFNESPKILITSNFAPNRFDESTLRRLLFVPMSDYYHKKTEFNNYDETRRISDDFGFNLFDSGYSPDQWNADLNFLIDCLQYFLQMKALKKVVTADLRSIYSRINLAVMGDQFNEWAEGYFLPDGPNLDVLIRKADAFNDFVAATGLKLWSSSKFSRALASFCRNNSHYIECLNPPELCPASTPGRIVRKISNRTEYYIYIKTVGTDVAERYKDDQWI